MKLPDITSDPSVIEVIRAALAEDIGPGDVTSNSMIAEDTVVAARIIAKETCTVAGTQVAREVFRQVDDTIELTSLVGDGEQAAKGETILSLDGRARGILTGERTALNFMQRMSGIASLTRQFTELVADLHTTILDTRKTTPSLRPFEKYSVLCGGGTNHRMGLYDRVLIKDNHRSLWRPGQELSLDEAVRVTRERCPGLEIEIEVESLEELTCALRGRPDWVLLDNMSPALMRAAVEACRGISRTEASGGITLDNVRAAAESGVDAISLGCLTHSAPSVDLSLEIVG